MVKTAWKQGDESTEQSRVRQFDRPYKIQIKIDKTFLWQEDWATNDGDDDKAVPNRQFHCCWPFLSAGLFGLVIILSIALALSLATRSEDEARGGVDERKPPTSKDLLTAAITSGTTATTTSKWGDDFSSNEGTSSPQTNTTTAGITENSAGVTGPYVVVCMMAF